MNSGKKIRANEIYAFAFGLFLGLCIWKFGNPVILDQKISPPNSFPEFLGDSWPTHWANWILLPLVIIGGLLIFKNYSIKNSKKSETGNRKSEIKWLWLLPLLWFGWQLISATQTVDSDLTVTTLWQFFGCVACYFLGAFLFQNFSAKSFLLIGILIAFAFCLVRAADQKLVEFPQNQKMLLEGQRNNWTNLPPEMVLEMKHEQVIITTNGMDVANPAVLAKFAKDRVMGTLVYPNALAGIILLLLPVSLTLAFSKKLRPIIRAAMIALTIFLGFGGLFWSGSKGGWLIAMAIGGLYLFRLRWPVKLKITAIIIVAVLGSGIFAVRFHNYFAKGATSVVARFDYWRAAAQTAAANPILGTGPGTFQRPYAKIKSPDAEMARLTHNDYLEQFSDSGIPGGIFYATWIFLALAIVGKRIWKNADAISFAIFAGLLGWFVQGLAEFSLFIPALAWTAFALLGCLVGNQFDKNRQTANLATK
jgi:O-antigen ligase